MKIGTKSVLYGAHCFFLHPIFVAAAWIKLYGWPWDPRIWIAFFVHDLGYWGKPNMDGVEGEKHVELGAKIMHWFDGYHRSYRFCGLFEKDAFVVENPDWDFSGVYADRYAFSKKVRSTKWRDFSMFHSRYYAKKHNATPSKLCFADKLAFSLTPRWLYLPMVRATGEINEYMKNAAKNEDKGWIPVYNQYQWHSQLKCYMRKWVAEHIDGREDTWTDGSRNVTNDQWSQLSSKGLDKKLEKWD